MRLRTVALAAALLLVAGQVAGCAGRGGEGESFSNPSSTQTELLVAAGVIVSVLLAGLEASGGG